MDLQYCCSMHQAVNYVTKYVAKQESGNSPAIEALAREGSNIDNDYSKLRRIGNAILNSREASGQEVKTTYT